MRNTRYLSHTDRRWIISLFLLYFWTFCKPAGFIAAKLVAIDDNDIARGFVGQNGDGISRREDSDFPYGEFALLRCGRYERRDCMWKVKGGEMRKGIT